MTFVIFIRMPSRRLVTICDEDQNVSMFDSYEEALELIETHILSDFPWQIVEVAI